MTSQRAGTGADHVTDPEAASAGRPHEDESIEVADGVAAAGRRAINEDWAATIIGLALLALTLLGVIGKGMVP